MAIALFFALGTAVAAGSPTLFGYLVQTGVETRKPFRLVLGFVGAALVMILAAAVAWWLGVDAERRSLEDVTMPLTAETPEGDGDS
jgi:hypothetical protein